MKLVIQFSVLFVLLILACSRQPAEYLGPAYISAPEGFAVTSFTATPASINFTAGSVLFNATFTNNVTWTLTIKGKTSGAVREVRGSSSSINETWTGIHDGVTFFRTGETVAATLSFFGTALTAETLVVITKAPDYTTCGTMPRFGDFDDSTKVKSPYWGRNIAAYSKQGFDSAALDYTGKLVPLVQGRYYYYIKGVGAQGTYVAGLEYKTPSLTLNNGFIPQLPATPDNVWINMYVYGSGNPNTEIDIELHEDDIGTTNLGYLPKIDDAYIARIYTDHKGWKLFSFKYSELPASANPDFGGSGNKLHEPDRLRGLVMVLLKRSDPNSPAEAYFDYPILTVGGPFKPCH